MADGVSAQTLNWEGQTGIFVTPFAYVAPSPDKGLGMPIVGYHYLNAGDVLGGFHQLSLSASAFHHLEFGYTRDFHQPGSTLGLSNLWSDGFNVFHGKLNFLSENVGGLRWMPALSAGFAVRSQVQNVGGVIQGQRHYQRRFLPGGDQDRNQCAQASNGVLVWLQGDQCIVVGPGG